MVSCGVGHRWLGSGVAGAVAKSGSYSSDWTPSLGTSIRRGCGPKKTKKKKKKRKFQMLFSSSSLESHFIPIRFQ